MLHNIRIWQTYKNIYMKNIVDQKFLLSGLCYLVASPDLFFSQMNIMAKCVTSLVPVSSTNRVSLQNEWSGGLNEQGGLEWSQIPSLNDCFSPQLEELLFAHNNNNNNKTLFIYLFTCPSQFSIHHTLLALMG